MKRVIYISLPLIAFIIAGCFGEKKVGTEKERNINYSPLPEGYVIALSTDFGVGAIRSEYRLISKNNSEAVFEEFTEMESGELESTGALTKWVNGIRYNKYKGATEFKLEKRDQCKYVVGFCYYVIAGKKVKLESKFTNETWFREYDRGNIIEEKLDEYGFLLYKKNQGSAFTTVIKRLL